MEQDLIQPQQTNGIQKKPKQPEIAKIFDNARIVALGASRHSGKTNNIVFLIKNLRDCGNDTPVYIYGLPKDVTRYCVRELNCKQISSLRHLANKKDCFLILDEIQSLRLNDRRYKSETNQFANFVHHNNVYVLLSSPEIRQFNTVIGGIVDRWLLKTSRSDQCVNGSPLKKAIEDHQGSQKSIISGVHVIKTEKNELIVSNNNEEVVIICDYIEEADSKLENKALF